jgi:protocadherin delta 1
MQIEYQLSQSTLDSQGGRVFAVDPLTGDVTVIGRVDRELSTTYRLLVTARNRSPDAAIQQYVRGNHRGGPETPPSSSSVGSSTTESSDAIVIIHVEDANDNPPTIAVNTLLTSSADIALVPEGQDPGTFVAHVIVQDPDEGRNGRFECSLTGDGGAGDWFRLVSQGDDEFQVVTAGRLDRELRDSYQLQLTCKDGGLPPLTSLARLRVQVCYTLMM